MTLLRNKSIITQRHRLILSRLSDNALTAQELAEQLGVSQSTVFADLKAIAHHFPEQVEKLRGCDARTVWWRVTGLPPMPLAQPIDYLTADEITALVAARGLLRAPDTRSPGWEKPSTSYSGDLSQALHGLLERAGLSEETKAIAPRTIGVSRFGIAPEAPGALADLERALRTDQCVYFTYRNRDGIERELHLWPIRLVLIKGEWYLFAWAPASTSVPVAVGPVAGKVKQYALSRIISRNPTVRIVAHRPSGAPVRAPHDEVNVSLATGFHATGGGKRSRVVLAVSPQAWPSIVDRTWGEGQEINEAPANLPTSWRRIAFSTSGLTECRHWVLSFGAAVHCEGPRDLQEWLKNQAQEVIDTLGFKGTPIASSTTEVIADTMSSTSVSNRHEY